METCMDFNYRTFRFYSDFTQSNVLVSAEMPLWDRQRSTSVRSTLRNLTVRLLPNLVCRIHL